MIRVGVFGATGYTGIETLTLLRRHPQVEVVFATSETHAGRTLRQVYPWAWEQPLLRGADAPLADVEAVFCCLPHAASMPVVARARAAGVRVIDLSADFRLTDPARYRQWYGVEHTAPHLLAEAVYGLAEVHRDRLTAASLVANPGCYPTGILLALYPLLREGLLHPDAPLIADSKSGVSGAGRKPSLKTHFVEVNENLSPYNIGRAHRHTAEMAQLIAALGGPAEQLLFSPHLVPVSRGMLSTLYVTLRRDLSAAAAQSLFEQTYAASPLVRVLPPGELATFAHTRLTNACALSVTPVDARRLILCASLDNLGKGAAGQAVQNFNLMFGLDETTALL